MILCVCRLQHNIIPSVRNSGYRHQYLFRFSVCMSLQCFGLSARAIAPSVPILLSLRFSICRLLQCLRPSELILLLLDSVSVCYCSALDHQRKSPSVYIQDSMFVGYCSALDHQRWTLHHHHQYHFFL